MAGRPRIENTRILDVVDDKGVSTKEISFLANHSYSTTYNKLRELEAKGLVSSWRDGGRRKWKRMNQTKLKPKKQLSIKTEFYETFYGEKIKRVKQVGDGSIIKLFDHTPQGELKQNDIVCPAFLELKWANGCMFNCSWCYLQGTFRFFSRGKKPYEKPRERVERCLNTLFKEDNNVAPEMLNAGEISDSLLNISEKTENPFSKYIIRKFEEQSKYKLLLLTKSTQIENLIEVAEELGDIKNTIVSFTINAQPVARKWEKGAPSPVERIEAAKKLYDVGYPIRFRVDPIVPILGWEESYEKILNKAFKGFRPSRITLGSLRGLQTTINNCKDKSWTEYLSEDSKWGKKVDFSTRLKIYGSILKHLEENYHYTNVGLCKETREMWDRLNLDYRKIKCNCVW